MQSLLKKFNYLEEERTSLLEYLKKKSVEDLQFRPGPGKWSVAQILEHMRIAEKQTLKGIKYSLENRIEFKFATFSSDLAVWIARLAFKLGIKFKAPAFVADIKDLPEMDHIFQDWQFTRDEIRKIIETLPVEMTNKIIFKHPILGLQSMHHILDFQLAHFKVHRKQIYNILNKLS
jgi:hypothetical protein